MLNSLPNALDYQAEIKQLLGSTNVSPGHKKLLNRLNSAYPFLDWHIVAEDFGYEEEQVYTHDGDLVSPSRHQWIEEKTSEWSATQTWRYGRENRLVSLRTEAKKLVLAARVGERTEDFIQMSVFVTQSVHSFELFKPSAPTISLGAMGLNEHGGKVPLPTIADNTYTLHKLIHVQHQLEVIEDEYRIRRKADPSFSSIELSADESDAKIARQIVTSNRPYTKPLEKRLFDDWFRTCGYAGHSIEHHWWFEFWSYTNLDGTVEHGFTPQWSDRDGGLKLPTIDHRILKKGRDAVLEALGKFDAQTGYDFSWYFYMLHGNRVTACVGQYVVDLISRGYSPLSNQRQQDVLLEWAERPYSF